MRELKIGANDAGQRVDVFLSKALPSLPSALLQKFIRLKRVKVNGARCHPNDRLSVNDVITLYIDEAFFLRPQGDDAWRNLTPRLDILYEDENILIADKRPGILVHSDESGAGDTLIDHIKKYLFDRGEWDPARENSFAPALAHRIDRNTGGLVIAAKTAEALRILNERIREREVRKFYLCLIHGEMIPRDGRLEGYIERDMREKRVYVHDRRQPGALTAVTLYRTIAVRDGVSLVECELETGRTHQIRAQFAAAGHPLVGDGKYGTNEQNRGYRVRAQALYAYRIIFSFSSDAGALGYLNGRTYESSEPGFVRDFHAGALKSRKTE